jgi:hypothetical protein
VLRVGAQGRIYDLRFVPRGPLVAVARAAGVAMDISAVSARRLPLRPYLRFTIGAPIGHSA